MNSNEVKRNMSDDDIMIEDYNYIYILIWDMIHETWVGNNLGATNM